MDLYRRSSTTSGGRPRSSRHLHRHPHRRHRLKAAVDRPSVRPTLERATPQDDGEPRRAATAQVRARGALAGRAAAGAQRAAQARGWRGRRHGGRRGGLAAADGRGARQRPPTRGRVRTRAAPLASAATRRVMRACPRSVDAQCDAVDECRRWRATGAAKCCMKRGKIRGDNRQRSPRQQRAALHRRVAAPRLGAGSFVAHGSLKGFCSSSLIIPNIVQCLCEPVDNEYYDK